MPPLPTVAASFVAATLAGALLGGPAALSMAAVAVALMALPRRLRASWLVVLAAVALAGAGHARAVAPGTTPSGLARTEGTHHLVGHVERTPELRGATVRFDVAVTELDGRPAEGGVHVTLPGAAAIRAGDRVRLNGEVERPPALDGFDYAAYLRSHGIDAVVAFPSTWEVIGHEEPPWLLARLRAFREHNISNIERVLPEPEASLAVGMLLGSQRAVPDDLEQDLRVTGTTHLLVVSGQNVALVLGIAVAAMSASVSRRVAAVGALLLLPGYVVLVGAEPPVARAALMAVGLTLAEVLGRRTPAWVFLVYAAAAMLALDRTLATSLSFQLSFAATAGVLVVAPPLRDLLFDRFRLTASGGIASIVEVAAVSTGAAVAVAPIQIAAFGTFPLLQVPANILVAPLYEATLVASTLAVVAGDFEVVVAPARALLTPAPAAFRATIRILAGDSGTLLHVSAASGILVPTWYALLGVATWCAQRMKPVVLAPPTRTGFALTLLLALATAGLWSSVLAPSEPAASVTVLDVGQGLAILVRDRGNSVLVDAGPPDGAVIAALGRVGQHDRLEAAIITHSDVDHAGGLDVVKRRLGIGTVLAAPDADVEGSLAIDIGDRIHVSDRTTIEVLSPPRRSDDSARSDNDRSLVLLVSVGERRFLLSADIEADAERWLVGSGLDLRADAIVIPHHGSTTSSTASFTAAVQARLAVVSVGAANPYGHPSATVLDRYGPARVLRTDEVGDVTLRTDGSRLWVRTARAGVTTTAPAQRKATPGATVAASRAHESRW